MNLREFDGGVTDRFIELRAWLRAEARSCWSCATVIATRAIDHELGNAATSQLVVDCHAEDKGCRQRATELWLLRPKATVVA
jgi:hypothetical protein